MSGSIPGLRNWFADKLKSAVGMVLASFVVSVAQGEELTIPGSGNPEYVLRELAKAFNAQQGEHRVVIPVSSGTAGALRALEQGNITLGRVGRPLKAEELAKGLIYIPMGRDAVAFVTGAAASVKSITRAQAVDIYSGKITDWADIGGKPAPIRAIGRESTDTSRQTLDREIGGFSAIKFSEQIKVVHLDPQLIELLDRYPTSLGFINRSATKSAKTKLNVIEFDGISPSLENLSLGRYPLTIEFGFAHKSGLLSPAAKAFLAFVRSPSGERILHEHDVLAWSGSR
jgi:phosphate transport system substrate-binding protein